MFVFWCLFFWSPLQTSKGKTTVILRLVGFADETQNKCVFSGCVFLCFVFLSFGIVLGGFSCSLCVSRVQKGRKLRKGWFLAPSRPKKCSLKASIQITMMCAAHHPRANIRFCLVRDFVSTVRFGVWLEKLEDILFSLLLLFTSTA